MINFPSYVWCPKNKTVYIYESKNYVLDDSEYGSKKYKIFNEFNDVKRWIKINNLKGSPGRKLLNN